MNNLPFVVALLSQKDKEIDELKSKIAEVMAVMPAASSYGGLDTSLVSSILFNSKYLQDSATNGSGDHNSLAKTSLDPNASIYTPKIVPSDL